MQFERSEACSCELWSLRFALSVVVVCRGCFCLVWCSGSLVLLLLGAEPIQWDNYIGDAGASSLGEGLKCNSSVQMLQLVSCEVDVCNERCCCVQGMFLFGVVQWESCFASSWR